MEGCKPDNEINFELAKRFNPDIRWKNVRELMDDILKPSGMTYEQLAEHGLLIPSGDHSQRALPAARTGPAPGRQEARLRHPFRQGGALLGAARGLGLRTPASSRGAALQPSDQPGALQAVSPDI